MCLTTPLSVKFPDLIPPRRVTLNMVLLTDNLSQASEFGFSAPGKGSGNKEIEIALSEIDKSSSYLATSRTDRSLRWQSQGFVLSIPTPRRTGWLQYDEYLIGIWLRSPLLTVRWSIWEAWKGKRKGELLVAGLWHVLREVHFYLFLAEKIKMWLILSEQPLNRGESGIINETRFWSRGSTPITRLKRHFCTG